MESQRFRFAGFDLDPAERSLRLDGRQVEVSGRYFDALELLVRESGRLVTKERFMAEVWRGVPVTDEALTQCVRLLRRELGDDAARPRFIQTVPKHGYRFIAPVERAVRSGSRKVPSIAQWPRLATLAAAGTAGGATAGLVGGLLYGFAATGTGIGSGSTVLVLLSATFLVGLIGAAGVSAAIAVAAIIAGRINRWSTLGGAIGGLLTGAIVEVVGLDAFTLLVGRSPGDITGAGEGALLGAAAGLAVWITALARRPFSIRYAATAGAASGAIAGLLIALSGGRLMAGSLSLVADTFPSSRLRLDQVGAIFGEEGLGMVSQIALAGLEGALFVAGVVAGMAIVLKRQR